ncbi:MAG TPA: YitT family protein [Candidatus Mediterraneibacter excrementigallinarum]|nr:YitT family protein [Candidatus Mediterraneibacter excrementigallinarum]
MKTGKKWQKIRNEIKLKSVAADLLFDVVGSIFYAAGIYTFAGDAEFAPGGVSGLALILNYLLGLPVGTVTLLFNIPLVAVSYRAVGKMLLIKSARTMVISSLILDLLFPLIPVYSGNRMMAALYSGLFMGAGMAVFYLRGSSSGGIDFLALAIKKKKPHLTMGVITLLIDLVVIVLGWPVFGDIDAVLYGVASTGVSTIVIDKILYGSGAGTLAIIITDKGGRIAERIGRTAKRGVTEIPAVGGYTGIKKDVLLCACSKAEAHLIRTAVEEADDRAFLMFTETSEVFGEGFRAGDGRK